jgi:hypothetical protein
MGVMGLLRIEAVIFLAFSGGAAGIAAGAILCTIRRMQAGL